METMMERLAKKKSYAPPTELTVLPIAKKEHADGETCGDGCGCGNNEESGCCGG
ncbi:MAG TPA: hypothetical protein VK723_02960 [Thermoplasmata archaeon]|nr:hypothetical protein [Thermoplasmata archaeon]